MIDYTLGWKLHFDEDIIKTILKGTLLCPIDHELDGMKNLSLDSSWGQEKER
jgi:hypothetical protein